jgi:hypothetical protein
MAKLTVILQHLQTAWVMLAFMVRNPRILMRKIRAFVDEMESVEAEQRSALTAGFDKQQKNLIVFLVPPFDFINGGVMSICFIASETKKLEAVHHSKVMISSFPKRSGRFLRYSKFRCDEVIFQFEEILSYFSGLEKILIHVPDFMGEQFTKDLARRRFSLAHIPKVTFNIMNQNVDLMPSPETIQRLSRFGEVTCTTAHSRYCSPSESTKYGIRYHHMSAHYNDRYFFKSYREKDNLMVVSPDPHPMKDRVLKKIAQKFPNLEIRIIKNLSYDNYLKLIARAKWSLTFGEGMDGYYVEPLQSGALPFAVYNATFFPNKQYGSLMTNFTDYTDMLARITDEMSVLDYEDAFEKFWAKQMALFKAEYSQEDHLKRIRLYYENKFSYPREVENSKSLPFSGANF